MKKKLMLLCSCALLLSMTACKKEPPKQNTYKNGTYQVQWDSGRDGYADYLRVEIKDDVVTVLEFDGVNAAGSRKGADKALQQAMLTAQDPNLPYQLDVKKAYSMTVDRFNAAQGDLQQMELVAGATETSDSFVQLLEELLQSNAKSGVAEDLVLPYYADGSYTVTEHDYDGAGMRHQVTVTVTGGQPAVTEVAAKMQEQPAQAEESSAAASQKNDKAEQQGQEAPDFTRVQEQFNAALEDGYLTEEDFAEAEDTPSAVLQKLVQTALANAHLRGAAEDTLSSLKDGVYRAEMSEYTEGWKEHLVVAVSRGRVQIVEFDAKNEQGSLKSSDSSFAQALQDAPKEQLHPDSAPAEYYRSIVEAFHRGNDNVLEMENVAGATISTNHFKLMMGQLMGYNIPRGDTELMLVEPHTES